VGVGGDGVEDRGEVGDEVKELDGGIEEVVGDWDVVVVVVNEGGFRRLAAVGDLDL
jgi:hypothetical protein